MKKELRISPCRLLSAIGILSVLANGCSTYSGAKLTHKPTGEPIGLVGIPYGLVRAEYSLSRNPPAAGEKGSQYTLGVTYDADPAQMYTIRINPGIFADPNFTIKLGANGAMIGTSATFTDQITPTITSLGSFAATLTGTLAHGIFDKDSVRQAISSEFTSPPCTTESDVRLLIMDSAPRLSVGTAMKRRMDGYKDDETFASRFHYRTEKEKTCLAQAGRALEIEDTADFKPKLDAWSKARAKYKADHPDDLAFLTSLIQAVATDDTKALVAIKSSIESETGADGELTAHARARADLFALAQPAASASNGSEAKAKVEFFVQMDSSTWRARNLLYLESEIDRIALFRLQNPTLSEDHRVLVYSEALEWQRAETIGAGDLYARAVELSRFLANVRTKAVHGGVAPATTEYATARSELDTVLTQIDARRARVLADAKPPPAAPEPILKSVPIPRVNVASITQSRAIGWASKEGQTAPDYVLVLEETP